MSCGTDSWITSRQTFGEFLAQKTKQMLSHVGQAFHKSPLNPSKWVNLVDVLFSMHWKVHLAQMSCANLLFLGPSERLSYPKLAVKFMRARDLSYTDVTVFDSRMFLNVHNKQTHERFVFEHTRTFVLFHSSTHELLAAVTREQDSEDDRLSIFPPLEQDSSASIDQARLDRALVRELHGETLEENPSHDLQVISGNLRALISVINCILKNAATIHHIYTNESANLLITTAREAASQSMNDNHPMLSIINYMADHVYAPSDSHLIPCCYLPKGVKAKPKKAAESSIIKRKPPPALEPLDVPMLSMRETHTAGMTLTVPQTILASDGHALGTVDHVLPQQSSTIQDGDDVFATTDIREQQRKIMARFIKTSTNMLLSLTKRVHMRGYSVEQLQTNPFYQVSMDTKRIISDLLMEHIQSLKMSTQETVEFERWSLKTCKTLRVQFGNNVRFTCTELLTDLIFLSSSNEIGPWFVPFDKDLPDRNVLRTVLASWNVGKKQNDICHKFYKRKDDHARERPHFLAMLHQRVNEFYEKHDHLCIKRLNFQVEQKR